MRRRMDGDLKTRFQAPKRVGPPIKNQGPSRVDKLQAVGYYRIMNKKEAKEITGGLSAPGKMPEGSYNLPAVACITGAKYPPTRPLFFLIVLFP